MKKLNYIFAVLTVCWMAVIFVMSGRDADKSTEDSYKVGMLVGRLFVPGFEEKSEAEQLEFAAKVDHPVRKTAHACEYALLAALFFAAAGMLRNTKMRYIMAWLLTTVYAGTDEIHQLFVPGRSGQLSDVCLDSAGAVAGVLFCLLVMMLIKKKGHQGKAKTEDISA